MADTAPPSLPQGLGWTICVKINGATAELAGGTQSHWSLDLEAVLVDDGAATPASAEQLIRVDQKELEAIHPTLFTTDLLHALTGGGKGESHTPVVVVVRLLFPQHSGTPARSDVFEYRLQGAELIHSARSFLQPLTPVTASTTVTPATAHTITTSALLLPLLTTAMGALIATTSPTLPLSLPTLLTTLTTTLTTRLSLPYLLPPSPSGKDNATTGKKRILWIQGRANPQASLQFYRAAHALGLLLIVADEAGHWMQPTHNNPYAHYREAFVELDIAGDAGLADRIVDLVKGYPLPIDGVVCISDVRLAAVARACEVLGLPTEGRGPEGLGFPLIVKPCTGWNSDCVVKVWDVEGLRAAVERASARHQDSAARNTGVVVEPYVDGPEVDANFVVLDGEVLFCDVTDDFPCAGDLVEGSLAANFMETLMDVPSALPADEQSMMREALRQSIARCGFASGVFHCEARVRGSRAYYAAREDNGILDLHVGGEVNNTPSCYLHEVNARPPGYINCVAALLAYGVDYYAIRLLLALGPSEHDRIKALAQPFLGGEPQYTLGIAVLPPTREGIMGSEDAVLGFLEANPDLREHVVFHQTVKQRGEVVQGPDSSELWCVGYIIVASRAGRKECLELAQRVRERFTYKLMEDEEEK
ncbi:carnosine synthase [Chaetomidium leptoderma]|uniref:Carnosine synthase n=1 Tax=Chaetomidium leptoderma TaxID=669021 RepID=A0AAN7A024_9PEZI|nr:carnosine synthase [Chaetomidium leptoderma]